MESPDTIIKPCTTNPCCKTLMKKYRKILEGRNALKESIEILEKAYKLKESELIEESSIRIKLEKENNDLKAQLYSYSQAKCEEKTEDEGEIEKLKLLLQEEQIKRIDFEKKQAEASSKKVKELLRSVETEKRKADEERSRAEAEKRKATQYRLNMEKYKAEADEAHKKLISESYRKDRRNMCNNYAESMNLEKQIELIQIEKKKAMDEKARADHLLQQLEEEMERNKLLNTKIEKISSAGSNITSSSCLVDEKYNNFKNPKTDNVKLLKKRIKQSKRHEKRMTELQKKENAIIMQQLDILQQSIMQISCHFNVPRSCLRQSSQGLGNQEKFGSFEPYASNSQATTASLNCNAPTRLCTDFPLSSIDSIRMEPPCSSAIDCIRASFTDQRFIVGAQANDGILLTVSPIENNTIEVSQPHSLGGVAECSYKRKRAEYMQEPMTCSQLHSRIGGNISEMKRLPSAQENDSNVSSCLMVEAPTSHSGGICQDAMRLLDMDVDVEGERFRSSADVDAERLVKDMIGDFTNGWPLDNSSGIDLDIDCNGSELRGVSPFQQASSPWNAGHALESFNKIRNYDGFVLHELPRTEFENLNNFESLTMR